MHEQVKREAKIIMISLAFGLGLALLVGAHSFVYSDAAQRGIAENVLRFHVNAHSDDTHDQALKEDVRLAVLAMLETGLNGGTTLEVSRSFVLSKLREINDTAQSLVYLAGYDYMVNVEIAERFFPTTVYGELSFPPGLYETLTVSIGDGYGRNWWCLMFPPLCYVEMTGTQQTRRLLEENVPAPGFALLTHRQEDAASHVAVRFRVVEWWQNRRAPAAQPGDRQLLRAKG
jgi:stage II sporulation protein R